MKGPASKAVQLGVLAVALAAAAAVLWFWSAASPDRVARPNLVIVVIDALRKDHLSGFGYGRPTSPALDRLAGESVMFENVLSPSSHTVPVLASLWTGLYPSEHGVQYFAAKRSFDGQRSWKEVGPALARSHRLLPERLAQRGYRTAAVVSNPWLQRRFGFAQGFEHYQVIECLDFDPATKDACDGAEVVEHARRWLERPSGGPFFLYLHFMDVHAPYDKPGITQGLYVRTPGSDRYCNCLLPELAPTDLAFMTALYDEGIHHLDQVLGRFIGELERWSPVQDTVLVVLSDHGDELLDHGGLGHGTTVHAELTDSFLMLRYPARLKPRRIANAVSLVDLAPTVWELAGFEPSELDGAGRSLVPLIEGGGAGSRQPRPLYSELGDHKAVRLGRWKLMVRPETGATALYDLESDPAELRDRASERPRLARELKTLLRTFQARAKPSQPAPAGPIDPELLRRLRALGYLGS